jgi:replicative DNA helicase
MSEMTFGKLGQQFQQALIKSIIEDPKYGEQILEVLESKYFDNNSFKYIVTHLKELTERFRKVPDYETIKQKIMGENLNNELAGKLHSDTLKNIQELQDPVVGSTYVKETALKFCKQQDLKKTLKQVNDIIEKGDFESYDKITEMIQDSLQVGTSDEDIVDIADDLDFALDIDPRVPIPTGIGGLDNILKGGIGRGELGMILAPTGVGKSTILSKFANTAANTGHGVVQVFFEDTVTQIKQKHMTVWSGLSSDEQLETADNKAFAIGKTKEVIEGENYGVLKFIKMQNGNATVGDIRRKLLKLQSQGMKIDMLVLDYVDCLIAERGGRGFDEEWKGEGGIIRQLDAMASDLNIALWTASQGNRGSISADIVNIDDMGGSIKKAQTAHIIISVAKTLEQKENKRANMTIVKSRIGRDGVTFNNCLFDNEYMKFDLTEQDTLLGHEMKKRESGLQRAASLYKQTHGLNN